MSRIFISHSHSDEVIAYKLVNFLLAALGLKEREILSTSNPDQGLSYSSSSISDQLKNQLKNAEALIVLITADSLHSAWIPFEVGSFWTTDKPIIPILEPGLTQDDLPGPLKSFLSIPIEVRDVEDRLNNAINQLAKSLNLHQEVNKRRNDNLQEFCDALRAWQSKRPKTDLPTQEEVEQLKARIQELEYEKKLLEERQPEELEKLKKERSHKNKKIIHLRQKLVKLAQFCQTESFIENLGNDIKLEMISIPGGEFMMGTEDEEIKRLFEIAEQEGQKGFFNREQPRHEVIIQPFFIGQYPVTKEQYNQVISEDISNSKGDKKPVVNVSWNDAVEFCHRLSKQTGKKYRLPTEAEWEYACRAGTDTAYGFGDIITPEQANYNENVGSPTAVGTYWPNAFGLYDMHGNVWEWCEDDWDENYQNAPINGSVNLLEGSCKKDIRDKKVTRGKKVIRGGSWGAWFCLCRSAYRDLATATIGTDALGFRVVCVTPY